MVRSLPVVRGLRLGLVLLCSGILCGCTPVWANPTPAAATPTQFQTPFEPAATEVLPTATPTAPPPLILGSHPAQVVQAASALDDLAHEGEDWGIQLSPGEPDALQLEEGVFDLALLPDAEGLPVATQPLALAVPLDSDWGDLSLGEALELVTQGSPYIAVLPWNEMTPDLRALRVDGLHPGEAGYPLTRSWSLHHRPGTEAAAQALAPLLAGRLADDVLQIAAVGDVMLDRTFRVMLAAGDLDYPFRHTVDALRGADLTIGNLESALGEGGHPEPKGYTFRAPPAAAASLAGAGFDLMSLANNHAMDFGPDLLLNAIGLLQAAGVETVGAGSDAHAAHAPAFFEVQGVRLAFLAYVDVPQEFRGFDTRTWQAGESTPGVAWADPDRIRDDVSAAKQSADLVVVLLHSGYEYVPAPSDAQRRAAHTAAEAGADLVLGHHAHVLQGMELYQGCVIAYGLGNFAFEDAGPPESGILRVWIDRRGVRGFDLLPVLLDDVGRPGPADDPQAQAIRALFLERTRGLLEVIIEQGG